MFSFLFASPFSEVPVPIEATPEEISFNGYGFQNSQIKSIISGHLSSGSVSYNTSDVPQDNGKIYQSRFWREKSPKITGTIICDSASELEAKLDEIKAAIGEPNGLLKYRRSDGTFREIHATLVNEPIERDSYHITWIPFILEFKANDPFWRDSAQDSQVYSGVTTSPFIESINNFGNEITRPQTYFSFSAAAGVTSVAFTVQGRTLTWTGTIAAGDLLLLDCLNKSVTLNGISQDYDGTFPEFATGANSVTYTINGTFTADIVTVFYKNYR